MRVQNHRKKMRCAANNFRPYFNYIWENYIKKRQLPSVLTNDTWKSHYQQESLIAVLTSLHIR